MKTFNILTSTEYIAKVEAPSEVFKKKPNSLVF